MFQKNMTGEERLTAWRSFRQSPNISENDVLTEFAKIDQQPRYIDYYGSEHWPPVFDIVYHGMFCASGICLTLAATLMQTNAISPKEYHFAAISNYITGAEGLVFFNGNDCYNFIPGEKVTTEYALDNGQILACHNLQNDKYLT